MIATAWMQPFVDYGFMRRALVACLALGVSAGPIGCLLTLRRMTLMGDAMSHAILPGAAVGFLVAGLSLPAMGLGGLLAGLAVVLLAAVVTRFTNQKEDAGFASFYLTSLALGVLIISRHGSSVDILQVLFGTILAIDGATLWFIAGVAMFTLCTLAFVWRPLVLECYDAVFLRHVRGRGTFHHYVFMVLVALNLVASFQALGTLMAVGLLTLPATAARFWTNALSMMVAIAVVVAAFSGFLGLLVSYHYNLASGPAIILVASLVYLFSLLFGPGGLRQRTG